MPTSQEEDCSALVSQVSISDLEAGKRVDYLSWEEYFMAVAFLSAQRSKDPRTQVGACIVNSDNRIVGVGYNGFPFGSSDDEMSWARTGDWLETKHPYVCHAELNAVLNKNSADCRGCSIYVALFPCNECAKILIQSGIKAVVYYSDKYSEDERFKAARIMFKNASVQCRQFRPRNTRLVIDFEAINASVLPRSLTSSTHEQELHPHATHSSRAAPASPT